MTTKPETNAPARDWRFPLIVGLAIGIGVPIARHAGPALGVDNEWGLLVVNTLAAGVMGLIVALVVVGVCKLVEGRKPADGANDAASR